MDGTGRGCGDQSVGIQLLPRSKVLKRDPSAATMSATSALSAETLTRSAVVGDFIRCHRVPSVVSKISPLRPTTQHTLLEGASPANNWDCTPLSCFCQLFPSVDRKIVPKFSTAQYTERSGEGISTAGVATGEAVAVLAFPTVGWAVGAAAVAVATSDSAGDPTTAGRPLDVGCGEGLAGDLTARWPVRDEVSRCFDRLEDRRDCHGACARLGKDDGVATGCCNSLAALAVGVGTAEASISGADVGAVEPSAAGDDAPASVAVDALAGAVADALGAAALGLPTAAADDSGVTAIVGIEGCVAATSRAKRARLARRTCRTAAMTTSAIAASVKDSRATAHTRLRFGRLAGIETTVASGDGLTAAGPWSADFTALANLSSISSLGTKLGLRSDPTKLATRVRRSSGNLSPTAEA
jgi:hypothetical protein